jgi:pilus assembly protein Flp/PilA
MSLKHLAGSNLGVAQPLGAGIVGMSKGPIQPVTKRLHREKTHLRDSLALGGLARNPCIISKKRRMAAYLEFGILAACSNENSEVALECLNTSRRTKRMKNLLKRLWREEEGQDLVEYGLLLALLALAAVTTMGTLANAIKNVFTSAASNMATS